MSPGLFYLFVAIGLIGTELFIMQFSLFWFFFLGLGALVAALAGWLFPEIGWTGASLIFFLSSIAVSALLYPVLKKWQQKKGAIAGNDAINQRVKVVAAISESERGKVMWSGAEWPAELAAGEGAFAVGDEARIVSLEGIRLIVGR